ncbi:MAG: hybrid sensor histidine kinase/response regulator [Anaerolineae bacterium]
MGPAALLIVFTVLWFALLVAAVRRATAPSVARHAFLLYQAALVCWAPGVLAVLLLATQPGDGPLLGLLLCPIVPLGCLLLTRAYVVWPPPRSAYDCLLAALVIAGLAVHPATLGRAELGMPRLVWGLSFLALAAWLWLRAWNREPRQGPQRRRVLALGLAALMLAAALELSPLRGHGLELILIAICIALAALLMTRRRLPPLPLPQRRSAGYAVIGLFGTALTAALAQAALEGTNLPVAVLILAAGVHLAATTLTFPEVVADLGLWIERAMLRGQFDARRTVEEVAEAAPSVLDLEPLVKMILERMLDVLDIRWGLFALWDRTAQELRPVAGRGVSLDLKALAWPADHQLSRWLLAAEKALPEGPLPALPGLDVAWLVPVRLRDEPVGLFAYGPHRSGAPLTTLECSILSLLANETSAAVANARLFNQVARARQEWLQTFDALSDGVFLHDRQGRILRANRAFARLVDRPFPEIIAQPWHELIPAGPAVRQVCWQQASPERSVAEYDISYGEGRTLHVSVSPVSEGDAVCVHVLRDVTEERAMQRQLAQAEKLAAIGQMLSGVAHELNNPLTTIIGFSELLQEAPLPAPVQADLNRIYRQAQHSARIVQSLLAFARQSRIQLAEADVNGLVRQVLEFMQPQLDSHHVRVHLELAPSLPTTLADAGQLQQVLLNLITNALQAIASIRDQGCITIKTTAAPTHIVLTIADNGPGIEPDLLSRIFDPFFTTKNVGEGTGLGLSICYGIVREHGGRIWAESQPGQGAVFHVQLPLRHASTVAASAGTTLMAGLGRRILVVEDDEAVLALLERALGPAGLEVTTARDGVAGLQALAAGPLPDLVIADLRMPRLDGPGFYDRLRRDYPSLARRVLLITGDAIAPSSAQFLQSSGLPYLRKPFGVQDLLAAVSNQLAISADL